MEESASSASKKRKNIPHDHHEEDEDENMEKFYALVKSIREARDRLIMINTEAADHQSKTKKRKVEDREENINKQVEVWKPSFKREDFMDDHQLNLPRPAMSFASTSSQTKELGTENDDQKDHKEVKEGPPLDLTLSL